MKSNLLCLLLLGALAMRAAATEQKSRESVLSVKSSVAPIERNQRKGTEDAKRSHEFLKTASMAPTVRKAPVSRAASDGYVEKMTKATYSDLDGNPYQCTLYSYTDWNARLRASNCYYNEDGTLYEYSAEEAVYDENHNIVMIDMVTEYGNLNRIEYEYAPGTDFVIMETASYYDDYENEWVAYERINYIVDDNGNRLEQMKKYFDSYNQVWINDVKVVNQYDAKNRAISQYVYVGRGDEWVPDDSNWSMPCMRLVYDEYDRVAEELYAMYDWDNSAWFDWERDRYDYIADTDILSEFWYEYWNRETKSWIGGDDIKYEGDPSFNKHFVYEFDDLDRYVKMTATSCNEEGDWNTIEEDYWEYSLVENDEEQTIYEMYFPSREKASFPFKHLVTRFNTFGKETYYYNVLYNRPIEETITSYNEYGVHTATEMYGFNDMGTRFANIKESFTFADDWDPQYGWTPIKGGVWQGVSQDSDDEWLQIQDYAYAWELGQKTYTKLSLYNNTLEKFIPYYELFIDYDFNTSSESILMWLPYWMLSDIHCPYKVTREELRYNLNSEAFNGWDEDRSWIIDYEYKPIDSSGIEENNIASSQEEEIGRYDISGRKVDATYKGLVIVRYSDGSSSKKMIR